MDRKPPAGPRQHQKASTMELSDGWSLVTKSRARTSQVPKRSPTNTVWDEAKTAKILSDIEHYLKLWRASECHANLRKTSKVWEWNGDQIGNVICLGLGSLCTDVDTDKRRSLWQLACFLSLSDLSSSENGTGSKLYAQEPRFIPADRQIFKNYNVEVLDNLNAREYITPRTLIFAPFLQWTVLLQDILKEQYPAICISLDIRAVLEQIDIKLRNGFEEAAIEGDIMRKEEMAACVQLGKDFLKYRDEVEFPEFELHSDALRGLRIYTKKTERADDSSDD